MSIAEEVRSCFCPVLLSFHDSLTAILKFVTAPPDGRYLVVGSEPKVPTAITLLMPFTRISSL